MELRHLRHFIAVAEELHFARAAERLGMEQSPLSQSIRNLERDLKTKLFHRTTRRTWLTPAGTRFYEKARRILADVETAKATINVGEEPARIRLTLGEDLAGEPFTKLLSELERRGSGMSIAIQELTHDEAARLVRDGEADVALTLDRRPVDGLAQRRAWGERLMLVAPADHPLAARDGIRLEELATEPLALPRSNVCPGYLAQIEALLDRHEVEIAKRITVRHWNTAVSFAATGRALALCPASFINGTGAVAIVPIEADDAELETWLLYSDAALSPEVTLLLDIAACIDAGEASSSVTEPRD